MCKVSYQDISYVTIYLVYYTGLSFFGLKLSTVNEVGLFVQAINRKLNTSIRRNWPRAVAIVL